LTVNARTCYRSTLDAEQEYELSKMSLIIEPHVSILVIKDGEARSFGWFMASLWALVTIFWVMRSGILNIQDNAYMFLCLFRQCRTEITLWMGVLADEGISSFEIENLVIAIIDHGVFCIMIYIEYNWFLPLSYRVTEIVRNRKVIGYTVYNSRIVSP